MTTQGIFGIAHADMDFNRAMSGPLTTSELVLELGQSLFEVPFLVVLRGDRSKPFLGSPQKDPPNRNSSPVQSGESMDRYDHGPREGALISEILAGDDCAALHLRMGGM